MGFHNRVVSLRDVLEWTDTDPLPEGATITVEGGQFVLAVPSSGGLIDAGHSQTDNPDLIDAGNATTSNPDTVDAGSA